MPLELTLQKHSDQTVYDASQSTLTKYPEIDQAATIEKYRQSLKNLPPLNDIERVAIKSKRHTKTKTHIIDLSVFE